jgi:hypothetical protein
MTDRKAEEIFGNLSNRITNLDKNFCCYTKNNGGQPLGQVVYGTGTGITSDEYFTRNNINTGGDGSTRIAASPTNNVVTVLATGVLTDLGNSFGSTLIASDLNTEIVCFSFVGDSNGFFGSITNDACLFGRVESSNSTRGFKIDNNGIGWGSTNTLFFNLPLTDGSNGSVFTTDGAGNLTFNDIQSLLSHVPSYANNAAAITGGLVIGNTYYNSTSNVYKRVV